MPTRILAIRHGETDWNVAQRMQGHTDIPLNDLGQAQAQRLAQALGDEDLQAIYASDLLRARMTAAPLAVARGLSVHLDQGLRERCFGDFEGHTYTQIDTLWPQAAAAWRTRDLAFEPPGGGESLPAFHERCLDAVRRIVQRHRGESIALVAHGGVLDMFYRSASRAGLQAPRTWQLGNASINRLLWADEGLMLVGWNDAQHLEGLAPTAVPAA
jgi:probable phosphoglycerate mutase